MSQRYLAAQTPLSGEAPLKKAPGRDWLVSLSPLIQEPETARRCACYVGLSVLIPNIIHHVPQTHSVLLRCRCRCRCWLVCGRDTFQLTIGWDPTMGKIVPEISRGFVERWLTANRCRVCTPVKSARCDFFDSLKRWESKQHGSYPDTVSTPFPNRWKRSGTPATKCEL